MELVGIKPCSKCEAVKPLTEFHASRKASDGRASWCKACVAAVPRERRGKRLYSAEQKRRWQLATRYGLTPEQFSAMELAQDGCCKICGVRPKKFHVDHCHNTGEVRGLLCHRCNTCLGGWDNVEWRENALRYLGLRDAA